MNFPLTSLLLSALVLGCSYLFFRKNAASSCRFLGLSFTALLLVPVLMSLPKWEVETTFSALAQASEVSEKSSSASWLLMVWALGAGTVLVKGLRDYRALRGWLKHSHRHTAGRAELVRISGELGLKNELEVRVCRSISGPCVMGLLRPILLLPASSRDWSEATWRCVLLHELSHLARRDLWFKALGQAACVVHWFNPLVWILHRRAQAHCEFACDAHVLKHGADAAAYAHSLCDVAAEGLQPAHALGMGSTAHLKSRVEQLFRQPGKSSKVAMSGAFLLLLGATSVLALTRPVLPFTADEIQAPADLQEEAILRHQANPFPAE